MKGLPGQRRVGVTAIAVVVAGLVVACVQLPAPPELPALPPISASASTDCLHVVTAGDSLMVDASPHLEPVLESSGRCATVTGKSYPGLSSAHVADLLPGMLDDAVADVGPVDVLVVHLIGNDYTRVLPWSDPNWVERTIANAVTITQEGLARGIHVYWALPPKAAFGCAWDDPEGGWNLGWPAWNAWIRDSLVTTIASPDVHVIDWRTPFGGEEYHGSFTFPDGSVEQVRVPDCTHLTEKGGGIAAYLTTAAIQHEWTEPVAPLPPDPTTTTSEPTTTTSTTTTTTEPATG